MMADCETLYATAHWFEAAVPEPTNKSLHTQLGVHFEEVAEMVESLRSDDDQTAALLVLAELALSALADRLKTNDDIIVIDEENHIPLLDALCDQIVTAVGVGYMMGFEMVPAMVEVNDSNWSKFVKGAPIFDENQKIQKGPHYFKANLAQFI